MTQGVRLGVTVPVAGERLDQLGDVVDDLIAAGYRDLWTSELTATDAFAPLQVAATRWRSLRLGTAVACVFTRSPALLAMNALALAESSTETACLGLGASSLTMVQDWHGVPFTRPYARVRDTVRFLRAALTGERVTFRSDTFDIDGFRLARTPQRQPKILIAALRERMLRPAGAETDGVVLNWLSPDDVAKVVPLVRDQNPDADVVARLFVVTGRDRQAARDLARRQITGYLSTGVYAAYQAWLGRGPALEQMWQAWQAGDRRGALRAVPDSLVDELFLIGTVRQIRAGIADYVSAGVTMPVVSVLSQDPARVSALVRHLGTAGPLPA